MNDSATGPARQKLLALLHEWPLLTLSVKTKFALKVALSLTLAYMVPMAMGWSQPSTAATTVMLIAATGGVRDSLLKGSLRLAGTVVGAIIGLTLIALFAQDRLLYLLSTSVLVSLTLFLYKAYRGDGTLFMLAAVVMLMMFNGGNAEDAFLYGLDRAYMTAFGIAIYTLVGSFLWPVHDEQDLAAQALTTFTLQRDLFLQLKTDSTTPPPEQETPLKSLIKQLSTAQNTLREQWLKARGVDPEVKAWGQEWHYLLHYQQQLSQQLIAAQNPPQRQTIPYADHITEYPQLIAHLETQFADLLARWNSDTKQPLQTADPVDPFASVNTSGWQQLTHLQQAQLTARLDSLRSISHSLQQLAAISAGIHQRTLNNSQRPAQLEPESAFILLDADSMKTAIQVFITFWCTSLIWILFNPPGGYMFVVLSTVLVVLVSFTPVQPKQLYMLFTLGFICALPCYIFLLPQLSRAYELALFLLTYTALAYYFLPSPVNLFFMFGLFTLGIDNQMSYHLDVVLTIMLMFYLTITALFITTHMLFPSKPEKLFLVLRKRLFRHLSALLALSDVQHHSTWQRSKRRRYQQSIASTLQKMRLWASKIDSDYFPSTSQQALNDYVDACTIACFRANTYIDNAWRDADNTLLIASRQQFDRARLIALTRALGDPQCVHNSALQYDVNAIEDKLDQLLERALPATDAATTRSHFYLNLNLLVLLWHSLQQCELAAHKINWLELKHSRF